MTNLKEIHLRLDEETKAQWLDVVNAMGEKMQSRAFRRIVQKELKNIESKKDGNENK